LGEDPGVAIKKVFIEHRIIVGQGFGQSGETCCGDFLERGLIGFISAIKTIIVVYQII